jgi:glycosyltransferase involved in cell wall biosynthesis
MRVALFADCYRPVINGVVTSIESLYRGLAAAGNEVLLFVPSQPGYRESDPNIRRFASVTFPYHKEERFCFPWPPGHFSALARARVDVVHLHTPFNLGLYGLAAARALGLPRVFTHHTLWEEYVHYIPLPAAPMRKLAIALCRAFCNSCQAVIAPSAEVRQRLIEQGTVRPIRVVPTGIDTELFQRGDPAGPRGELGLRPEQKLFLYIGRLGKEKSLDFLLQAFAEANRRDSSLRLALIGGGPEAPNIEALGRELSRDGSITFLGYRKRAQLRDYLAAARGFLFASETETQGLVLLEAQAGGLPVVAVRASGVNEAVDAGASGTLVASGDREAFVSGVLALAHDEELWRRQSARAAEWVQAFSLGAMARQHEEVYRQAAHACRPGMAGA